MGDPSAFFDRPALIFLTLLALASIVVPVLALTPAEGSTLHLSSYSVSLMGKFLCLAMLAVALDLIWGYCGILSLGHGAFFALGGYAMGMYLMRQIGDRGVYGNADLPDFMVFLNWQELPWYWYGFDAFLFAMIMALVVPGTLAYLFGWLAFRSRVTGVYFSIMSQALTYALMLAFFRNELGFGGNNGLTDFKDLLGLSLTDDRTRCLLFVASALSLAAVYTLCRWVLRTRFGQVILAMRDAETRVRFVGYDVVQFKVALFTLSGVIAGLAGALYVPQVGIINPSEFQPLNSIEVVVWVAAGGRGLLWGAALGAMLINYLKTLFTSVLPEVWLFVLGALFIGVTLYLPHGVAGLLRRRKTMSTPR